MAEPAAMIESLLGRGVAAASQAIAKWLERPAAITVQRIERLPLAAAADALGTADVPLCVCAMAFRGGLEGVLLLACDDAAGLTLCDLLLGQPVGTAGDWNELARSAFAETTNIVGCAYLNAIAVAAGPVAAPGGIEPGPPWFVRDYPVAVMDSVLLEQALADATVLLARTEFRIDDTPIRCGLVVVPRLPTDAAGDEGRGSAPGRP